MLVRYKDPGKSCKVVKINGSNITTSQVVHQPIDAEYIFHLIQYAVCLVLRCMEYVLLAHGFYKFTQSYQSIKTVLPDIWSKTWKWGICWAIVLTPTLLLPSLATPAMAIVSEFSYASKLDECTDHDVTIYLVYAILTMFTYFFAYCVRVAMVFATIAISRLWFPEGYYNMHTSKRYTIISPNTNSKTSKLEQLSQEEQFIEDWSVVSKKHGELAVRYEQVGQKVECITQIFQTWFMIPWIIFFIVASAETNNALKPWSDGETVTTISALHYTIYSVNQILSLLIPYLCGLKMNMFHSKFHEDLRNEQMAEDQTSSRRALARIMYIEKIERFDFVSRVWGTNIKIRMSSPLYVVFLLIGIFFTICSSLFS